MPSFSLLKRIVSGSSQQSRQEKQASQQSKETTQQSQLDSPPPLPVTLPFQNVQNGSAKSLGPSLATTLDGSAVAEDSDHDSGIGGVGGSGNGSNSSSTQIGGGLGAGNGTASAKKERRNSKRDLLRSMIGKSPLTTPLRGRRQSQPAAPQGSSSATTFGVSRMFFYFFQLHPPILSTTITVLQLCC